MNKYTQITQTKLVWEFLARVLMNLNHIYTRPTMLNYKTLANTHPQEHMYKHTNYNYLQTWKYNVVWQILQNIIKREGGWVKIF